MKRFWQIIIAIAFGIILLEFLILAENKFQLKYNLLEISSLTSLAAVLYIFIFERKKKKS